MKSKEPLKKPLGKGLNNPISSKRGTSDGSLVKRKEPNIMANMGGLNPKYKGTKDYREGMKQLKKEGKKTYLDK